MQRILEAAGVAIDWDEHLAGWASLEQRRRAAAASRCSTRCAQTGLALKTKLLPPPRGRAEAATSTCSFRRDAGPVRLGAAAARTCAGLPARFQGVDMLVIRELTEDLYAAIEHEIVPGVVQSIKVVTEAACRRFFRFAFDWARAAGRKTIHCVHKANILKLADGLFLEAFRAVGQGLSRAADAARSSSTTAACRWCRGRSSSTCW